MNQQQQLQNMGYLPLLAEEGLKVVNSFPIPSDEYHQSHTPLPQHAYMPHYPVQGEGYHHHHHHHHHPHDRMQGMYIGGGGGGGSAVGAGPAGAGEDLTIHSFDDSRAAGLVQFNQPQYISKSAGPPQPEPKPKESRSKKGKGGGGGQGKKRGRDPKTWKRNANKMLRNSGQTYISSNGSIRPARTMKAPCKSCRQKCTERINEAKRQGIFDQYWDPAKDWNDRRMYIIDHALPQPIRRRRSKDLERTSRRISFHYYLTVDGVMEKVCKRFFLNTLSVGEKFVIISLHKKTLDGKVIPDRRGRHPAANQIPYEVKLFARQHIQSQILNRTEDHVNLPKMYESYVQECDMQQKQYVKKHFYRKLMNEELRIAQQRLDGPDAVRNEERPLDYTPTPQVSALECLIKELWQKEQDRIRNAKPRNSMKERKKQYQALRFGGKEYVNSKGQVRPSRKMKDPCDGCQKACSERIIEEERKQLFENFWDPAKDWTEKKKYVLSCTESHPVINSRMRVRKSRTAAVFNRPHRFSYFFEVDGRKEQVCRKFYVNTLGLSQNFIASCIAKQDENGDFNPGKTRKSGTLAKLPPAVAKEIRQHIIYNCWADPNKGRECQTHSSTKGWSWNVSKMYTAYRQHCWMRGTKPASTYMYRRVFCEEMKVFEDSKVLAPNTPSSSTRSEGKKQSEDKSSQGCISTAESSTPSTSRANPDVVMNITEKNRVSAVDEEEEEEEDDEYVASSSEDDDDIDDDSDEDYEPSRKRGRPRVSPKCSATTQSSKETGETSFGDRHVVDAQQQEQGPPESTPQSRGRRKTWDTADMRCAGQTYINDKGSVIPARKIKEPCQNCRKQCLERVPQEMREKLFSMFWSKEMTWEKKRMYMEECIVENAVKKRTLPTSQLKLNRKVHMSYTLKLGDWEQNVCKLFFLNTLGISQKFAIVSLRKQKERILQGTGDPNFEAQDSELQSCNLEESPDPDSSSPETVSGGTVLPTPENAEGSFREVLNNLLLIPSSDACSS